MTAKPKIGLSVWPTLLFLTGCLSSPQVNRITVSRELYEQWPIEVRQAVLDGKVEPGMTPEMVKMTWGKPSEVFRRSGPSNGGDDTVWVYRPPTFDRSPQMTPGTMGSPTGYDPSSNRSGAPIYSSGPWPAIGSTLPPTPVVEREVVFRDGVVFRADPPPET